MSTERSAHIVRPAHLQKSFLVLGSNILQLVLQFAVGILVIRTIAKAEYGVLSLANIIIQVLVSITLLGLPDALPAIIAQNRTRGDATHNVRIILTTFLVSSGLTVSFACLLYIFSPQLIHFFQKPLLGDVLAIFCWMLPALALISLLSAFFRGFEDPRAKILFQHFTLPLVRLGMVVMAIVFFSGNFFVILKCYPLSTWSTCLGLICFALVVSKTHIKDIRWSSGYSTGKKFLSVHDCKDLLRSSLPLLGSNLLNNLTGWTGTLVIAYYCQAETIATYNAPLRLIALLPIPLIAFGYLYLPTTARLFEKGDLKQIALTYQVISRWIWFFTLPALALFFFRAHLLVTLFFGSQYGDAAMVIYIMAIGILVHVILGPNGLTLVAMGQSRIVFASALLAGCIHMFCALLLIPRFGALGGALAMALGRVVQNISISFLLYLKFKLTNFSRLTLRPLGFILTVIFTNYFFLSLLHNPKNICYNILVFIINMIAAVLSPLVTGTITSYERRFFSVLY